MSDEIETGTPATDAGDVVQPTTTDDSSLSDFELVSKAMTAEEPAEAKGEEPVAEANLETESKEGQPAEETAAAEEPSVPVQEPEAFKKVFKAHPELKRVFYEHAAHKEVFPTLAEARQMRALFPTTEDAHKVVQQADLLLEAEQDYLSNPEKFLSGLNQGNADAFKKFASSIPEALSKLDPGLYQSAVAEPVVRSLLSNLGRIATRDGDVDLQAAVDHISNRLFSEEAQANQLPATDPRLAELEQFKQEAEARRAETVRNFDASVQRTFMESLDKSVDEVMAKLGPAMPPKALARAKDEIVSGVISKLTGNSWLSRTAASIQRNGSYDSAHLGQIVGLLLTHSKPLIGPTVKEVLNEWTSQIVSANVEQRTEAKKAATRKDIGAGNGNVSDSKPRKVGALDAAGYAKWSDMDIALHKHLEQ